MPSTHRGKEHVASSTRNAMTPCIMTSCSGPGCLGWDFFKISGATASNAPGTPIHFLDGNFIRATINVLARHQTLQPNFRAEKQMEAPGLTAMAWPIESWLQQMCASGSPARFMSREVDRDIWIRCHSSDKIVRVTEVYAPGALVSSWEADGNVQALVGTSSRGGASVHLSLASECLHQKDKCMPNNKIKHVLPQISTVTTTYLRWSNHLTTHLKKIVHLLKGKCKTANPFSEKRAIAILGI